ncbi:hypothetical protein ACWGB8_18280 [Kitasatospora sp. NPDC054939]
MASIDALIPPSGQADEAGLRALDPGRLARYVADPSHEGWRRVPCALALAGRVPEAYVPALLDRIRDTGEVKGVRLALLDVLGDRVELLPWLTAPERADEYAHRMPEAFLRGRARLGDLTAAPALAALATSGRWDRRLAGVDGLDLLADRRGIELVAAELGEDGPEVRAFRLLVRERAGEDVTDGLADPDSAVADLAAWLIDDPALLRAHLPQAPTVTAALRTALALYRITEDRDELRAHYEALGRPRVEVEDLDEELRFAVLREYGSEGHQRSDPRWLVEALATEPPEPPDAEAQLARAGAALAAAGLDPKPAVSCGEEHQQGEGTYHLIEHARGAVHVSTLGRFAAAAGLVDEDELPARAALEAAGFRWIDQDLGSTTVTDLYVYYFGHRGPMDLHTLLFYWQD